MEFEILHSKDTVKGKQILGVGVFEGGESALSALPQSLSALAQMMMKREQFAPKAGKTLTVPLADGETNALIIVGMGTAAKATPDTYRKAAYKIVRAAAERGASSVGLALPSPSGSLDLGCETLSSAIGCGAALAGYRFHKYVSPSEDDRFSAPKSVAVIGADADAVRHGAAYADAQCYARDLANEPGNVIDPATFEAEARRVADEFGLDIEVIEADELKKRGMNALLAVGSGSATPPRMIRVTYTPAGTTKYTAALVGKGITFDSGGLSLKGPDSMLTMKGDKTGACVVLAAVRLAAQLKLPVKVHAVMGLAENMPSGSSYRVDDIVRAYNGKTIEVINTDAEGRITLADSLSLASELHPDVMIDIATLTGACAVALGSFCAGLFSNCDKTSEQFLEASKKTGERFWRMPLDDTDLRERIKTPFADVKNSGGRQGGAITAAMFLEEFVGKDIPWMHLDIAATDHTKEPYSYYASGATGFGMRTIAQFLESKAKN